MYSVLMIYLTLMHVLVFFTIYYVAHNVHHGCDPALDNIHHFHAPIVAAAATTAATTTAEVASSLASSLASAMPVVMGHAA